MQIETMYQKGKKDTFRSIFWLFYFVEEIFCFTLLGVIFYFIHTGSAKLTILPIVVFIAIKILQTITVSEQRR